MVTWTAPAAITYGTPLSAVQLDATANVAGTFSYAPNAGAVPGLGEQTLNVTFAPTDTANYTSASASTRILVTGYATTTNPDGTVSITGSAGLAGAITIPSSVDGKAVTGIGQSAFAGCTELTSVTIPASVASIGDQAFSGCTGLTSVTISSGVKTIGADAFDGCTSLSAITLPESLTSIGDNAFAGCSSLVTVTIPAGVTSIGASPFAYCSDLTAIGVESGNTAYASVDGVLYDITLTTLVQFPPGYSGTNEQVPQMLQPARALVTAPGSSSSPNFRIRTSFVIPSCVTHIGTGAFAGSVNLSTVVVPGSVTLIDEGAFTDCAVLNTLSFQGNAPTVGTTAFSGDSNLTTVSYAQGTTGWTATVAGVATVQKSAPTLTWATPANFSYGTLLSAAQLNATANVAGDFSYSPAAGTLLAAGLHSLSVTFTPTDTADYSTAAATQVVNVNLTTPAITWPAPAAITYGTALSSTQLNATASVSGSFAYTPAAATILTPGSQTLSVTFTPDDTADYSTATATQTLLVNPAAPASDPAEAVVATGFQAVWSPVVGATGYYLDVSTDSAFSSFVTGYQALDVHNVTELGIAGLNPGTAYYYRVRAYDGTSTGLNSATTTVSTTATVSITSPLTVSTLAGSALVYGSADGTASAARFWYPSGLAVDASSNVVVADTDNNTIRKVTAAGVVTTIAGRAGLAGTADGSGTAAQFDRPSGIAIDGSGNTYIADTLNNTVRKMTSAGVVSTIAGQAGVAGNADGVGSAALFHGPQGLSVDASGNLYIADTNNQIVRKLVLSTGVVSTVAGSKGAAGSVDGTGTAALFNSPTDLVADSSGNVYVADTDNHTVRKLTSSGVVTTIAGHAGYSGGADGTGSAATFDSPSAITIDASGNLYVGDTGNFTIRQVVPSTGAVTTLAGLAGTSGSTDGLGSAARFFQPAGIVADSSGNLYIADTDNHTIRLGVLAAAPAIQSQPQSATVTAGASVSFSVTATGHPTLSYQWYFNGAAISGATSSSYSISSAQASNAGSYTVTVTNVIKSVTSNAATLTVSAATQPTKSGGGGGAPSWWFLVAVATLGIARFAHRRRNSP